MARKPYLTKRHFTVEIEKSTSKFADISCGVWKGQLEALKMNFDDIGWYSWVVDKKTISMFFGEDKPKSVLFTAKRSTEMTEKNIEIKQHNCLLRWLIKSVLG